MVHPNIIFINVDQLSWDAMSAFGNPWLSTPNMDRLQRHGITFQRSYCTDPVCGPARASWLTGTYTSENGVVLNGIPMRDDFTDLGRELNRSGYLAAHAGKFHVAGRDAGESFSRLYEGLETIRASGGQVFDPATTHAALDFLLHHDQQQPFFLQIGYINPHDICHFGSRYGSETIPDDLATRLIPGDELPPALLGSVEKSEIATQRVFRRDRGAMYHDQTNRRLQEWGEENWRYYRWNYYRYIEEVDREIGLVLDLVEASPWCDRTLLIFGSDHGEACGRHGTFQKFNCYEEAIRVPLIVASFGDDLGIAKGHQDHAHMVSGVDLMPTVLDYAGAPIPGQVQGRSVRALTGGVAVADWPDYAYVESNYWSRAIITARYKYITEYIPHATDDDLQPPSASTHRRGIEQLYDLTDDPDESSNLAADEHHSDGLAHCRERLIAHEDRLDRRSVEPGYAAQIRASAPRILSHYRRCSDAPTTEPCRKG